MTQVVAALIWDGPRFLICQRPAHKARGLLWEFVGGKVEPGESKQDALARECREELAVTVSVGSVFKELTQKRKTDHTVVGFSLFQRLQLLIDLQKLLLRLRLFCIQFSRADIVRCGRAKQLLLNLGELCFQLGTLFLQLFTARLFLPRIPLKHLHPCGKLRIVRVCAV